MSNLKIVLVGGGSYGWTPGVLSNLLGNPRLNGSHIVLHDLNAEALELAYQLALRYKELAGSDTTFERTAEQAAAFDGADFVVVTITTGGLRTMQPDLEIPEKYGIFQTVGDTVGPGGLSRALRNIPVFVGLGRAMERRCPNAWMLNLSNPLSALTRAVNKETRTRAIGLCHGIYGTVNTYADFFGVPPRDIAFVNTGLDHCSWFTSFKVQGRDAWEILKEKGLNAWLAKPVAEAKTEPAFEKLFSFRCGLLLGRELGALPAIGDRHIAEFFPNFLRGMDSVERYGLVRTSIADRVAGYQRGRERVERMVKGEEKPQFMASEDVLGARLADDIAAWILALSGRGPVFEDNMNAPNLGQVPQLPLGSIVETRGVLDAAGFHPLASPLPETLVPVVLPHALREELTVEAAMEGSFDKALAVMACDPLLPGIEMARPLLEELLAANKQFLPQFKL